MGEEGSRRCRCTHRCVDARIQGWTDSYKEVWMERRKEGQMDGKRRWIENKREKEQEEK